MSRVKTVQPTTGLTLARIQTNQKKVTVGIMV